MYQTMYFTLAMIGILAGVGFFDAKYSSSFYVYFTNISNCFCATIMFLELKETKVRNMLLECIRKFRGFIPYDSKNPKLISYEINEKLKKDLYKNFKIFNELEKVLLSLRFGFNGFDALPFDILSSVFNRTPGELIEIEMGAIDKYHKYKTNK